MEQTILAWHFVGQWLRDGSPVPPDGEWLEWHGPLKMCESGLHASRDPFDALRYAPGPILCRVECSGSIIEESSKLVCSRRRIIKRKDVTEELRYFARVQALSVIHLWEPPDVVLNYLITGDEKLRIAAHDAAYAAARDAACFTLATAAYAADAAATAAARAGAATILLERGGFLGGVGTASLVHTFCGLYLLADGECPPVHANDGLAAELAERMERATGIGPQLAGRVWLLPQHPVEFARIADELTAAEPGLEVLFHTEAVAAGRDSGGWTVEFVCRGRRGQVAARALVDASGDAVLAEMSGRPAPATAPAWLQRPAYVVGMAGVADDLSADSRLRLAQRLVAGVHAGRLDEAALGASFRSSGRPGEVFLTIDLAAGGADYDPADPGCLSALERDGRRIAAGIATLLAETGPAWRDAYISHWPVRAGVRESRRWRGRHVLTESEWLAGARFDDEAALATWPMEFRRTNRGPKLRFPAGGRPCGIPLGCLQAAGLEGVWCAGRCISVDQEVQASVRVMGTCFATGEAAGKAAAGE